MATKVSSFFEGATTSICLGVVAATTEEEVDRDSTPTPTKEVEERHRDHSGGTASSTEIVYTETIYVTLLRTLKFNAFILCMNLTVALLANIVFILLVYVP